MVMQLNVLNNVDIEVYTGDIDTDLAKIKFIRDAEAIVYGWSSPGKMPSPGYSIPASRCQTGSKLANKEGSVCFGCYAADDVEWWKQSGRNPYLGRYKMNNVKQAAEKRYQSLASAMWVPAQVFLIRKRKLTHFRWHDAGDIQSLAHLRNIALIAELCPSCKFWLPSREYGYAREYRKVYGKLPTNLVLRASGHMIDKNAPADFAHRSAVDSGKYDYSKNPKAFKCIAYTQDGKCEKCRACWSPNASIIVYPVH